MCIKQNANQVQIIRDYRLNSFISVTEVSIYIKYKNAVDWISIRNLIIRALKGTKQLKSQKQMYTP